MVQRDPPAKILEVLELLHATRKNGKALYTPEQIERKTGVSTQWQKIYQYCYPGRPNLVLIEEHESWLPTAPERWVYDPLVIHERLRALIGKTLMHIEITELEWDFPDRNWHAAWQADISEVVLHFEEAYPLSLCPLIGQKAQIISPFQGPGQFVYKDLQDNEFRHDLNFWNHTRHLLGKKVEDIRLNFYAHEGTEFFPEERMWWNPVTQAFQEECPADAADLQISLEGGVSLFILVGVFREGKRISQEVGKLTDLDLAVCVGRETADALGFGVALEGLVLAKIPI